MSDIWTTQIVAAAIGIVFTIIARLVDRYLPDPKGEHPLPDPPTVITTTKVTKEVTLPETVHGQAAPSTHSE